MEMLRVLLLTSTIGFVATSCHWKVFIAQLISFVFIVVFLKSHPPVEFLHSPCSD